jgi:hypothetical protein
MPIDASIALQGRPVQLPDQMNALAQMMQIKGLQSQQEMNQFNMDEKRRGVEEQNQLRAALSAPGADTYNVLLQRGRVKEATDFAKGKADIGKTDAETDSKKVEAAHKRADLIGQVFGSVRANPTVETAMQALDYLQQTNIYPAQQIEAWRKNAMANPASIGPFAEQAFRSALSAKDQLPKYETRNLGGTTDTLATDPVTGQARTINSVQNTQSPDNAASNERARSEGALNRGVQIRGQDKVDARSRETTAATMTKPFEVTGEDGKPVLVQQDKQGNIRPVAGYLPKQGASKPLTEGQAKAALFGSRMQASEEILDTLADKGVTTSIPGSRTGYGVGAAINALQPGERQQLDQAKRDFINAVLRRESGAVISPQEFDNAELQYFPQAGETPAQKAQKKANRELATRGILAEVPDSENRVKKIRGQAPSSDIDALVNKYSK